ncbi:hypothetical protein CHS0354_042485 [Potamilus streckersoni]|uniref:VASt domain-containing protein n=1 Tax=Potamilus streckersoni TaxID=2493646 RepID=A0AAE0VRP5_9BIVA|nr:hypothetical protein CHS0354_042485 [Potamilus streckersoni]
MDIESDDVGECPGRESGKIYVDRRISHSRSSSSGKSSTASSTCSTPVRQGNGFKTVATVTGAFNSLLRSTLSSSALGKEKKAHSVESLLPQGGDISKMNEGSASDSKFSSDRRKSLGTRNISGSTISIQYHKESSQDQNLFPTSPEDDKFASGESNSGHSVTFSIEGFSTALETDVKGVNSASTPISAFPSRKSFDGSYVGRNSVDLSPSGLQVQAFEKSLNNILEKCSETSLDLSLNIDSKDLKESRSQDDGGSTHASKAAKVNDKKRKSSSWYSMLTPTYKSRSEDFKRLFKDKDIPVDERLIVDYSCALQKEILVHGRMFITQNWICFYANIFRWETVLTISCKEIKGITKEKTARVIPNAIQITTDKEKFFFTSFSARDKTYLMLFRMWQNALLGQQMTPQELWHWVRSSYGEELGLTSSDEDYVSPVMEDLKDCLGKDDSIINKDMQTDSSDIAPLSDIQNHSNPDEIDPVLVRKNYEMIKAVDMSQAGTNNGAPTDLSDTTEEDNGGGEVVCSEHEHLPKLAHNEVYQMPVDKLFELILTDCPFFRNFTEARKLQDVSVGPWKDSQEDNIGRVRTICYTVPLNSSFGPKTSRTEEKQICYQQSQPGMMYIIDGECYPMGIPYADSFYVVNRYCLTRVSKDKCRLRVTSEVRFKKTVLLVKGMIERNSIQGVLDFFDCLGTHLRRECDRLKAIQGKPQPTLTKRKLRKRRSHVARGAATDLPTSRPTEKQVAPPTPIRSMISTHREEKLSKLNAETLVRIVCFILILLVMFNALLFYKLWSLETLTNVLYFPHSEETIQSLQNPPKSADEWMHLLQQQQFLHEAELEKWRDVLTTSVTLLDEMKKSLVHLKETLDHRLKRDTFTQKTSENSKR